MRLYSVTYLMSYIFTPNLPIDIGTGYEGDYATSIGNARTQPKSPSGDLGVNENEYDIISFTILICLDILKVLMKTTWVTRHQTKTM